MIVTAATNNYLGFWYHQDYTGTYYNYSGVWVTTASVDPLKKPGYFVELQEFNDVFGRSKDTETQYNFDLIANVGQTVYFAYKYTSDYNQEIYTDNL